MNTSQNADHQETKHLKKLSNGTSLSEILEIGGMLQKATMHEKGYIQLPVDAKGHEALLQTIDSAQWTINRGMGGIGYALAIGDGASDHLQDLGWLLNGLADLNSQLSNAKEQVEESQRHLSDKEA